MKLSETDIARFWSKVEKTDNCWNWLGNPTNAGYGRIKMQGKEYMVVRISCILANKEIKAGRILNICGNRLCINPDHLHDCGIDNGEDFFWRRVFKTETCWEWRGHIEKSGYGRIRRNHKNISAHRYSYQLAKGKIPKGMVVRHTCDNRICVNPDHLLLGTQKDNKWDAIERGRAAEGSRSGSATIDEAKAWKILELKSCGLSCGQISKELKVSKQIIWRITGGRQWKKVYKKYFEAKNGKVRSEAERRMVNDL